MSLDKAVTHKKEKRKPYRGAESVCKSCRNHGSCDWCKENRLHKFKKSVLIDNEMQTEIDTAVSAEREDNV